MTYHIRRVDPQDKEVFQALVALQKWCLPMDTVFPPSNGYWWMVFNEHEMPVGFAGMVPSTRWTDCMYLCRAGVLEAHQGHGLQARLIKVRLKKAKQLGMEWVITDTYKNPASANSLINCGFKLFDPTKPWAGRGSLFWRYKVNAHKRPREKTRKTAEVLRPVLRK